MNKANTQSRRIHILRDSVARRIAAGEVIDRPYSVIRELLDNSIDAGADSIDIHVEEGGLKRIRIIDNGEGMNREDLQLCYLPHATSKIDSAEDIYRLQTLGFRGEALSSIAACARLLITSSTAEGPPHTLEIKNGSPIRLDLSEGAEGTLVDVSDLFYSMPGRKKFLKSPGAESTACFRTFLEKALPFPAVQFRFFTNDRMKLFLPSSDLRERVIQSFPDQLDPRLMHELSDESGLFRMQAVFSSPSLHRRDRRFIHIYVNRRRIQEYSLIQAVRYAYDELLPGGSFPAAFIFLDIDPDLVDFNIHPAKREAKIKNLGEVHHQLVQNLKKYLQQYFLIPQEWKATGGSRSSAGQFPGKSAETPSATNELFSPEIDIAQWKRYAAESSFSNDTGARENRDDRTGNDPVKKQGEHSIETTPPRSGRLQYIGQVFKLFLVAQLDDQLYLIDQHAAHERIIYESLVHGPREIQQLLVPIEFTVEEDREELLKRRLDDLKEMGILIEQKEKGNWLISHLPARFSGLESEIAEFLGEQEIPDEALKARLFADLACKAAVKDGEVLDSYSAEELVRKALSLSVPRCPHGRPIWLKISRDELFQVVERI